MKQIKLCILLLILGFLICIGDFTLPGIPWDTEIQTKKYPNIAIDMVKQIDHPAPIKWKLSKKRLTFNNK
jgi:hypothetical protein